MKIIYILVILLALVYAQDPKDITKVHVVYMTHLDLGFTDTLVNVMNKYFDRYLFDGIQTSQELRKNATDGAPRFTYTTHSWLINLFIDCPQKLWPGLHCPNATGLEVVKNAVLRGDLTWHAFASNIEAEIIGDSSLVKHGIELSRMADRYFGLTSKPKATLSLRVK